MKTPGELHHGPLGRAPHVLITGAAGAIGGAIAVEVHRRRPDARLSLVDVGFGVPSPSRGEARCFAFDLSRVDELPGLVDAAEEAHGPIDGLVNCAGLMEVRRFESLAWDRASELLSVDLLAPLRLMHRCVNDMLERSRPGFVVNVASLAGRVPLKGCAFYGAAKAGLSMASEIAHVELAPRGIGVVTVYPGPVASALERGARAQYTAGWLARAAPAGRPDELATRIVDAVERGEPRVVYPPLYAIGYRAAGLAARVALALGPAPAA